MPNSDVVSATPSVRMVRRRSTLGLVLKMRKGLPALPKHSGTSPIGGSSPAKREQGANCRFNRRLNCA